MKLFWTVIACGVALGILYVAGYFGLHQFLVWVVH
jgi:hypothetical protein